MTALGPAELLAMSFVVLPQSLAAAFIAKRKGRRFWTWFLLSVAITIGGALVMIYPYIHGGVVGRLLTITVVFLTAPIVALIIQRRCLPIPDHPAAKFVPDAVPTKTRGWMKGIRYTIIFLLVILTLVMMADIFYADNIRENFFCGKQSTPEQTFGSIMAVVRDIESGKRPNSDLDDYFYRSPR